MEKRAEIFESRVEQLRLGGCEISAGFGSEHFKGINDGFCGTNVDLFLARVRIGDLSKEESCVLSLEDDKFIEPRIGFRCVVGHGLRLSRHELGFKIEDWEALKEITNKQIAGIGPKSHFPSSSFALQGWNRPLISRLAGMLIIPVFNKTNSIIL